MKIAVIGGDARQIEVIHKLKELGAKVILIGFDQLEHSFAGAVKEKIAEVHFHELDAIILPVAGTDHNGGIDSLFTNEQIFLTEEMLQQTPPHCTIYSGISNEYLDRITKNSRRKLELLFERNDVAIYNSIPTVEGTIMLAIQHTDFTIHGSKTVVLGFGRVGKTVARTFAAIGAKVKVGARKKEHLARIEEMNLTPFPLTELDEAVNDADICINTIPSLILTANVLSKMPSRTLIIDLASSPGGTDFRYAEKRGIKAILAPSLPGIVAPKTAGRILANVLTQLLEENFQKTKEDL